MSKWFFINSRYSMTFDKSRNSFVSETDDVELLFNPPGTIEEQSENESSSDDDIPVPIPMPQFHADPPKSNVVTAPPEKEISSEAVPVPMPTPATMVPMPKLSEESGPRDSNSSTPSVAEIVEEKVPEGILWFLASELVCSNVSQFQFFISFRCRR